MSESIHEKNYTPSKWSKRFEDVELLTHFFALSKKVTAEVRIKLKCELNVAYGTTERTKYDIYGTDLPEDAPIFIFIHGGYWQECSKEMAAFPVPVLVANGIKVITIGYDLCPYVRLGAIVSQIKTATEQILKYASDSGCRCVWIAGHSAGAHLATSLLHDKLWLSQMLHKEYLQLIKGFVLISGIYKLRPLTNTSFNGPLNLSEEEINDYSFCTINTQNMESIQGLKIIVVVGECDSPVFVNESREYAQKLITVADNVEYILLRENVDHFDIVERLVDVNYSLTKLILKGMSSEL